MRNTGVAIAASLTLLAATLNTATAQTSGTGTLVGNLMICRTLMAPVGDADGSTPDLADVTPGLRRGPPPTIRIPAQDVHLAVPGTTVATTTDSTGSFVLAGVPAAQPLTLVAQPSSGPPLVFNGAQPVVGSGQTLDLGTLGLGDCGSAIFLPQYPTPPVDSVQSAPDITITSDTSD